MRIPTSRIYRAFPELDRFTDEQCELLMRRVNLKLANRAVSHGAGCLAFFIAFVIFGFGFGSIAVFLHRQGLGFPPSVQWVDGLIWILVVVAPPAMISLLARDFVLRRQLTAALHMRIDRVRCPQCCYILIGQQERSGIVTCPECGQHSSLRSLGLNSADLVPPSGHDDSVGFAFDLPSG